MGYLPVNSTVFTEGFAGVVAALGAGFHLPATTDPAVYAGISAIAGAFAQALDTAWGSVPVNSLQLGMIRNLSLEVMITRLPDSILNPRPVHLDPATWSPFCQAIVAMLFAAEEYFSGQGIAPPSIGTGETVVTVPFAFTSPSPLILGALFAGQTLTRAAIQILSPFNGVAPQVLFGTTSTPNSFLECDGAASPKFAVQYENDELSRTLIDDILLLTVVPSGATQGAGLLLYKLF